MLTNRLFSVCKAISEPGPTSKPWKHSAMAMLRKPGKPKYDALKAHGSIALCNTLGACSLHRLRG